MYNLPLSDFGENTIARLSISFSLEWDYHPLNESAIVQLTIFVPLFGIERVFYWWKHYCVFYRLTLLLRQVVSCFFATSLVLVWPDWLSWTAGQKKITLDQKEKKGLRKLVKLIFLRNIFVLNLCLGKTISFILQWSLSVFIIYISHVISCEQLLCYDVKHHTVFRIAAVEMRTQGSPYIFYTAATF